MVEENKRLQSERDSLSTEKKELRDKLDQKSENLDLALKEKDKFQDKIHQLEYDVEAQDKLVEDRWIGLWSDLIIVMMFCFLGCAKFSRQRKVWGILLELLDSCKEIALASGPTFLC